LRTRANVLDFGFGDDSGVMKTRFFVISGAYIFGTFTAEVHRVNTPECKLARLSYRTSSQTVLSDTDRYRVFSNDSLLVTFYVSMEPCCKPGLA